MASRFSKPAFITFFTLIVLTFNFTQLFAENALLQPRVIDIWPLSGVELAPEDILTISFDQAMNQSSVEQAITVKPAVSVVTDWQDERTLVISAQDGWARNTSYRFTINTAAKAQNGLGLAEDFVFDIQTLRSLQVASITPENSAEGVAAEDARVVVTFDRPVVPLVGTADQRDLANPLTISPAIRGRGEWVNTSIYVYTATTSLRGNTTYTVTILAGLQASDGTTLGESITSTFRTLAPQTLIIAPTATWKVGDYDAALLDSNFEVAFSQPMDRESTEAAFHLDSYDDQYGYVDWTSVPKTSVSGTFSWNERNTLLTFNPDSHLQNRLSYMVSIETSAKSAEGAAALATPAQASFSAVDFPAVRETSPTNGEIKRPGRGLAVFRFNTHMNTASYEGHYTISPDPEGEVVPYVYDDDSLALEFNQQVGVIYTITLLPGIEDIYGNATANPFTLMYFVQNDDVRTTVQPQLRSELVEVGTYQDAPMLQASITGSPTITLDVYPLDLQTLDAAYHWRSDDPSYYDGYYYSAQFVSRLYQAIRNGKLDVIPWIKPENRLSTWTQSFAVGDVGRDGEIISIPLSGADGKALAAGLYGVEITSPGGLGYGWNSSSKMGFVLVVSDVALTVKSGQGEALVWVTDFVSAKPVADANVQLIRADQVAARGETDTDGLFRVSQADRDFSGTVFVESSGERQYGLWNSDVFPLTKGANTYLYTDRPIYRPGETVYYRGVVRDQSDMTYSVPDVHQLRVLGGTNNYYGYYGSSASDTPFFDAQVDVSSFGTFSGAITLPADLSLGTYTIFANSCLAEQDADGNYCYSAYGTNITFEVGEFRLPEYEVSVTPQQDEIIAGDPINALIAAKYYFGGVVGKANVTWNVYETYYYDGTFYQDSNFQIPSGRGYTFTNEEYGGGGAVNSENPSQTNTNGEFLLNTSVQTSGSRPVRMAVEATVTDESGQAISARSSVLVHPANVYVGLHSSETFGNIDKAFNVDVLTVTPQKETRPGQIVDLTVEEIRWVRHTIEFGKYEWKSEIIPVASTSVTTGQDGKASYSFIPPNVGIFRVSAIAEDEKGRKASSAIRVYARETGQVRSGVWWDAYEYDYGACGNSSEVQLLRLTPDSASYRPGDTAEIFIPNPYDVPATALITVERAGVMDYEVLTMEGEALTYDLPITDEYAPNVYVGVVLMRGISSENPDPAYLRGTLRLDVEPVNRRLNIAVSPSQQVTKPGDQLSFDIQVTDSHGDPAQAEVGVALTDEAALALRPPNSGTLEAKFYGRQSLRVTTSSSVRALLATPDNSSSGGCGGGGGGGTPPGIIRDDFIYTPLWSPHTVTDADGHATVSVKMPDNLTRWRLDARAVSTDTQVGQAEINVVSTLPLIVRPVAPRFFVAGDHMPLAAIVNNNTEKEQVVDVRLQATGVQVEGVSLTQTVTVEPNGRVRVEWPVIVEDADGVDMTVFAVSPDYQDAAKPVLRTGSYDTIPIYRYVAPETVRTGGILTSATSTTELISLPSRYSEVDGTLTVQLDPSLASAAVDGLDYLTNYPYQCIEQTVSRFLPNVVTYRTLKELGLETAELKTGLDANLDFALKKLANEQNADGGWGWFGNMESSPLTTAYALLGLVETQVAGYKVDAEMTAKAAAYLEGQLTDVELNTPAWELNRQAFMLYVLGRWRTTQPDADSTILIAAASLYDSRLELSYAGRAYLLMAYNELAPNDPAGASLVSDLSSSAILSATGAHWEEAETDWWNWGSDTRTTALVLDALVSRDPQNPLLPNIVRWLMIARRGDHWESTQETTWALIGLTDWMKSTGELNGHYEYAITLNDTSIGTGSVTPDNIQQTRILQAQVSDLLHDSSNQLVIERGVGEGALYYSANLNLELPADEVQPVNRGIAVNREYFLNEYPYRTVSSARVGDIITVRLSLTLPQDIYYFVLDDMLPAGTEVIDTNLLTATDTVDGPTLSRDDPRWYWGYWYFDKVELGDKGAALYADYLPRGAYVFTYQVRATSVGEFQVIPTQAYAFYQPEVFGRTAGTMFGIED